MSFMSQKDYAKHLGVNPSYISHLKKKGFIEDALVDVPGKKYPKIDSVLADRLLAENLDMTFTRGSGVTTKDIGKLLTGKTGAGKETFQAARTKSERFRAKQLRQNYEIKQGKWMLKSQVKNESFKAGRIFRDAMLNIPPRVGAILAAETDEHKIGRILIKEIEQGLKEIIRMMNQITAD
jgi:hypothetical protein